MRYSSVRQFLSYSVAALFLLLTLPGCSSDSTGPGNGNGNGNGNGGDPPGFTAARTLTTSASSRTSIAVSSATAGTCSPTREPTSAGHPGPRGPMFRP